MGLPIVEVGGKARWPWPKRKTQGTLSHACQPRDPSVLHDEPAPPDLGPALVHLAVGDEGQGAPGALGGRVAPAYDRASGRVHDGIDDGRLNANSGAESNIVAAQALLPEVVTRVADMLDELPEAAA